MYLAFKDFKISSKKKYTIVRTLNPKYELCFSRLERNKIRAANVITSLTTKNSRNNLFRSKQTISKVPLNIFRGLEEKKELRLMF